MAGTRRPRARTLAAWTGGIAAATLLVTGAAVAQGYDAEDLPTLETSVWVSREASGGQYARVNTDIGEIQSVNDAQGLAGIAQSGSEAFVFGSAFARFWPVDPASPQDLGTDSSSGTAASDADDATGGDAPGSLPAEGIESPEGTEATVTAGPYLLFTGASTTPSIARAAQVTGEAQLIADVDPYAVDGPPVGAGDYAAAASSVSRGGLVAMYSTQAAERRITLYDSTRDLYGTEDIASAPENAGGLQLTFVGERWVMLQAGSNPLLWVSGRDEPFELGDLGADALLQGPGADSDTVVIADSAGVSLVALDSGEVRQHVEASGTAARPMAFGDRIAAAWLSQSSGELWTSGETAPIELAIDGESFDNSVDPAPLISTNGDRAVLAETQTGMLWTVPDGRLIPLAAWTAGDPPPEQGEVVVQDASQQEPPVAEPDAFGVRANSLVALPVLYNDHDANSTDILSVDPASIQGLDPAFGTVSLVGDDQTLVVDVTGAVPSGSFTYQVTDGNSPSNTASVTLTVMTGNSAPQWCGDVIQPQCFIEWPAPQLAIGGTTTVDVLKGWVDPEGDALVIAEATPEPGAPIVAMPAGDGRLAIAHTDESGSPGNYLVSVRVMDAQGALSEPRDLEVSVQATPGFTLTSGIAIGQPEQWTHADIADYATGGSGAFRIADVVDVSATLGQLDFDFNAANGTVELKADKVGEYLVSIVVQDAATPNQRTMYLRYSVRPPDSATVGLPPLTAFVRPGEDTVVDVLGAAENTTGRVLLITGATSDSGALAAAVIDQTHVQVRSTDAGRAEGPLGTVRLSVTDSTGAAYAGSIAVFLVPPAAGVQPIALADSVVVRAGEVIDIPVLANDVAPRGERLALRPDVTPNEEVEDQIAFASGTLLRYRAPAIPGTYTVFYYAYLSGSPQHYSKSQVTITVVLPGANRAPQARDVEARTLAGRSVEIPIDVDALDPDGDPVTVVGVTQPASPDQGAVMVGSGGDSLLFYAPEMNPDQPVAGWQAEFTYTVRDSYGETDTAAVRVGVSVQDFADVTPVVFTDHVRVRQGTTTPITIEPLLNDRDPAATQLVTSDTRGTGLHIIDLRPNMAGLASDPASPYSLAAALMVQPEGTTTVAAGESPDPYPDGVVTFQLAADTAPGTYAYLYTVESRQTTSTAQALIVLTVAEGDSPDRPVIQDTVVTTADRDRVEGGGIDVLTGKVSWATGDVDSLAGTLSLGPGAPAGFSVRPGTTRIQGPLPHDGAVVPFQVTGTDAAGERFTTYGFLRIPAFDDFRLVVVDKADPIREETQGELPLEDMLDILDSDRVEVRADSPFSVHRPDSACSLKTGSTSVLVYRAGYFPMFTDTCTVEARLAGQSDSAWQTIVVPIDVEPKDPLAILTPVTLTLSIAQPATTIDLYDSLVTWYGNRPLEDLGRVAFSWDYAGTQFQASPASGSGGVDSAVALQALGNARTGTRESIRVRLAYTTPEGFAYDESVNIVLYVGLAPSESPTGANLQLDCNAKDDPTGCEILAVLASDGQGQFNPLKGAAGDTRLRLVGVGGGNGQSFTCTGVANVGVQGDKLRFTWLPAEENKYPGGTCIVPFTVQDAQGHTGQGQVSLEAAGYPQKPRAPVTTGFGGTWVQMDVTLGDAAQAHPGVTGVVLSESGVAVPNQSCAKLDLATYRCRVDGLANGAQHQFAAAAVNSVGESVKSSATTTNAYQAPRFTAGPDFDDQRYADGITTTGQGVVRIVQVCAANDPEQIQFKSTTGTLLGTFTADQSGCVTNKDLTISGTGPVSIVVTPISQFSPPQSPVSPSNNMGGSETRTQTVRGKPTATLGTVTYDDAAGEVTVNASITANFGDNDPLGGSPQIHFLAWSSESSAAPVCASASAGGFTNNALAVTPGSSGTFDVASAASGSPSSVSNVFTVGSGGLTPNQQWHFRVCVSYGYGWAQTAESSQRLFRSPGAPTSDTMTYTPATHDMSDPSIYTAPSDPAAPVFQWSVPNTPPENNAASDFAAQMAGLDPPPSGSTWMIRYKKDSPSGTFSATQTSITDNESNWYAKFCFTVSGEGDFCGPASAAIRSDTASVGIAFGSTGTVVLPTIAQCRAIVDDRNEQIADRGTTAYNQRWQQILDGAYADGYGSNPGYNDVDTAAHRQDLYDNTYYPAALSYYMDPPNGWQTQYNSARAEYIAGQGWSEPLDSEQETAANDHAEQVADDWARSQAQNRATSQAAAQSAADGDAAGTTARNAAQADTATNEPIAQDARRTAESQALADLGSGAVGAAPTLGGSLNALNTPGGWITIRSDAATRRFTQFDYDFTLATARSPYDYVEDAIDAFLPTAGTDAGHYLCG